MLTCGNVSRDASDLLVDAICCNVNSEGNGLYFVEGLALYVFYRVTCTICTCGTSLLNITNLHF